MIVHQTRNEQKNGSRSKSRTRSESLSRKSSSLRKRVSFDETPVEISSANTRDNSLVINGNTAEDIEEFELPELQEDDLFSTYESLKAHASPSPPPLLSDLSKEEKKTLGKAKSPPLQPLTTTVTKEPSPPLRMPPSDYESSQEKPAKPITFRELDVSLVTLYEKYPKIVSYLRAL